MRKILPAIVIVVLLLAGGIHYYVWAKQAAIIKNNVRVNIDAANKELSPLLGGGLQAVAYEGMRVEGWPFSIRVVISRPVYNIPISAFIGWRNAKLGKTAPAFNWVERFEMPDGDMAVVSNLSGSNLSLQLASTQKMTTLVDGKIENTRIVKYEGHPACQMIFHQGYTGKAAPADMIAFLKNVKKFKCDFPRMAMTDGDGKTSYSTMGALNFDLASENPAPGFRRLDFTANVRDFKSAPEMDVLRTYYATLSRRAQGLSANATGVFMIPESAYGTQNYALDLHYYGPDDPQAAISLPEVQLDLNRLDIRNDLYTFSASLHMRNAPPAAGRRSALIQFKSQARFTPQYDELVIKHLQSIASYAQADETRPLLPPSFRDALKEWKPEDINKAISELYPSLSAQGDIAAEGNMTVETDSDMQNGTLKVENLVVRTTANGLSVNSVVTMENRTPASADTVIVCIGCEEMLGRLAAYVTLVNHYAIRLYPTTQEYISPKFTDAIRAFLANLAKTADTKPAGITEKDWVYHVAIAGPGQMTLNARPFAQVLGEFMDQVAQYIPTPFETKEDQNGTASPPARFEPVPMPQP